MLENRKPFDLFASTFQEAVGAVCAIQLEDPGDLEGRLGAHIPRPRAGAQAGQADRLVTTTLRCDSTRGARPSARSDGFHWQSKARTRRDSREGRRHLHAEAEGCTSLLLVRERVHDRPGVTMAFRYLGLVVADGDSGERPITDEWQLRYAMPAALLQAGRVAA